MFLHIKSKDIPFTAPGFRTGLLLEPNLRGIAKSDEDLYSMVRNLENVIIAEFHPQNPFVILPPKQITVKEFIDQWRGD